MRKVVGDLLWDFDKAVLLAHDGQGSDRVSSEQTATLYGHEGKFCVHWQSPEEGEWGGWFENVTEEKAQQLYEQLRFKEVEYAVAFGQPTGERVSYCERGYRDGRVRGYKCGLPPPAISTGPPQAMPLPEDEYKHDWGEGWIEGYMDARHCTRSEVPPPPEPPDLSEELTGE